MLKASVAAYLSGSRVLMVEPLSVELVLTLLLVVAVFALLFAFALELTFELPFFGGTQAKVKRPAMAMVPNSDRCFICRITHLFQRRGRDAFDFSRTER